MKQEIMNEIKQAMEQAQKWVHDPKTNLLYVEVEPLYWKAIYPPEEMSTSIPAACVLLQHAPALLDEIEQLRARVAELEAAKKTCRWHETNTDEYPGVYTTGCGHMFSFNEGDRADNGAVYCQYCGGLVQEGEEEE